jgi:NADPH:quinone reductase-like Zn-dependent oxidoreductase
MKAVVLHEFGGPEVLQFEKIATPDPLPGEVLIKVHNVSVNVTLDVIFRKGLYPRKPTFPHVIGTDPVGEIVAIGDNVTKLKLGDRVCTHSAIPSELCVPGHEADDPGIFTLIGLDRWGGYAEYVSLPESVVFAIPDNLTFPDAAVIMRHLPTARHLLHAEARLKKGEWVLVMGATGGLASCCVQVAKLMGANVIAAAGSDERVQKAQEMFGADYGVNYRAQDLAAEVKKITDGHGADVVTENIGDPELWQGAIDSLAAPGRLVTAGAHAGSEVKLNLATLYRRRQTIIGNPLADFADVEWATAATDKGSIRAPIVDRIMPLHEAAEAHRLVEQRVPVGKILLDTIQSKNHPTAN